MPIFIFYSSSVSLCKVRLFRDGEKCGKKIVNCNSARNKISLNKLQTSHFKARTHKFDRKQEFQNEFL